MKWFLSIVYAGLFTLFIYSAADYFFLNNEQPSANATQAEKKAEEKKEGTPAVVKTKLPLDKEFPRIKEQIKSMNGLTSAFKGMEPAKVEIPKIDVSASIEKVGTLSTGQMDVPKDDKNVGWFEPGTKVGNAGNAVFAGHVDNKTGPAVFYNLKKLEKGDEIKVKDAEGKELVFIVKNKVSYPRDKAPLDEIFGSTSRRNLNLITCTGTFDRSKRTHEERLVVYTELRDDFVKQIETSAENPEAPTHVEVNGNLVSWHAVRDEKIIGYRVYRQNSNGTKEQVGSVSSLDRKNYLDPDSQSSIYSVTSVDIYGQESHFAKWTSGNENESR
ncbi:class F sortase [Bacillus sp. FJAT-42376]|uniref:class F sortase n=1 Tax=Bacillus sp. FJAT-42376 TaxID=2014076 RepID=UPI000F4E809E|nr:class F sortase [Bacillus sp. FJAT-42376]AZB44376.1 class F sortase [Bacillus sp. FJAT-42376]